MNLKKTSLTDITDLKKICIDAYALNFHHHWNAGGLEWYLNKEFSTERLTQDLTDTLTEYYFIEHKLKIVGFIKTRNNTITAQPDNNTVELEKIYVLPAYKGQGIGKLALLDLIKKFTTRSFTDIFLCVIDTNETAIAFYTKLGFELHSTTTLDIPYFKEELKGMHTMIKKLQAVKNLTMIITNSTPDDIPEIFRLYKLATDFQKIKFPSNQWPAFDPKLIATEVAEGRQFKLVTNHKIACIWAITYSDLQIWEGSENDAAIYIHRIATNPEYRGHNWVQKIVDWAKEYAGRQHKRFIRMDTCGNNERLINHYKSCDFQFLGIKKLTNTSDLPSHYHNADVCFFEIDLG